MASLLTALIPMLVAAAALGGWLARARLDRCGRAARTAVAARAALRNLDMRTQAPDESLRERAPCAPASPDWDTFDRRLDRIEGALRTFIQTRLAVGADAGAIDPWPSPDGLAPHQADEWTVPAPIEWTPMHHRLQALENALRWLGTPPALTLGAQGPQAPDHDRAPAPVARDAHGPADDLTRIAGIGRTTARRLHGMGVHYFWQIAQWTPLDVAYADAQMKSRHGRIAREAWVEQARLLARARGDAQAAPPPP